MNFDGVFHGFIREDSSMASSIASSMQQMSMSFGLACASLVVAAYLGEQPQGDRAAVISALHHTFLTMGALTILSSLSFWTLRPDDGENVSKGAGAKRRKTIWGTNHGLRPGFPQELTLLDETHFLTPRG